MDTIMNGVLGMIDFWFGFLKFFFFFFFFFFWKRCHDTYVRYMCCIHIHNPRII